jgi:hypothetical protein
MTKAFFMRLLITLYFAGTVTALQAQLFQQNFQSSVTLSDYVNLTTPGNGQWNAITTTGAGTTISLIDVSGSNKLSLVSTANSGAFARTTDLSAGSWMFRFDFNLPAVSAPLTTGALLQAGSGYGTGAFREAGANTFARIGVNFLVTPGQWQMRDVGGGTNSATFTGEQTVLWVLNHSGSAQVYVAPDGTEETVANNTFDLWVGTVRAFNDRLPQTAGVSLADFKFTIDLGGGETVFDNFLIDPIPPVPVAQPANNAGNTSFTANWTAAAGVTGYRIDVATDAGFTSILPAYSNLYISGSSTTSLSVTGLTPGTTYYYRVRGAAQYSVGEFQGGSSLTQTIAVATLPLTLLDFSASLNSQGQALLNWKTTEEIDVSHFDILKSPDAVHFDSVGRVAAYNISSNINQYSFIDAGVSSSAVFYRLKMVDINGHYRLSPVAELRNDANTIQLLKNPVTQTLQLVHPAFRTTATAFIYDINGTLWSSKAINGNAGSSTIDIRTLPSGTYLLKINDGNNRAYTIRFIKTPG